MVVMPVIRPAEPKLAALSFIFQPLMSTGVTPVFVSSNQSAPTALLPLLHGATSVTRIAPAPLVTAVMFSVKLADASGVLPRLVSSTSTETR